MADVLLFPTLVIPPVTVYESNAQPPNGLPLASIGLELRDATGRVLAVNWYHPHCDVHRVLAASWDLADEMSAAIIADRRQPGA